MNDYINSITYFSDLQDFLEAHINLLKNEDNAFIESLYHVWDERILSKKLIELHLAMYATRLDAINPNQPKLEICKMIYWILVPLDEPIPPIEDDYRYILP